jgi:primary-amine oxidase
MLNRYGSDAYNAIVTFLGEKGSWNFESLLKLPEGTQPQITPGELLACETIVKNDARVQALAKEVGEFTLPNLILELGAHLPCLAGVEPHQIFADGWSIGYDDRFPKSLRLQQALLFARFSPHDNLYAHPLV